MPAGHIFLLVAIQAGVLFCHEESKLYPLVLPRAAVQSEITESGSGSSSGSGDILLPTDIESTVIPDYDSTCFISLTFSKLNKQQYHDNNLQDCVSSLLVTVLGLDSSPLIILMESDNVSVSNLLAYFAVESTCGTTLQSYAQVLGSTNNTGWTNLSEIYGLSAIEVKTVTTPMPWWHWLIIGLVIFLAASAYVLITIACCCRCYGLKRKQPSKVSQVKGGYLQLDEVTKLKLLEQTRQHLVRKVSRVNFQSRSHVHFYSHPLSVVDLEQLVVNPSSLYSEYATVPSNMVTIAEVPAGAEDKNRYRDVLPNPQTRVALFLKFGAANSDYINANYIRGYGKTSSKSYIATQGPLHWTVADFWRMVWEQKSSIIVMITNLNEKGMGKCVQYWPEERLCHSIVYEDLEVHLKRRVITKNYTTTTLLLQHKDKMVSRELIHFWFTGWPDHGVPTVQAVLEFLVHVRKHTSVDMPGPTVVHCSAGIGRTGVFIGADIAMQQLDEEDEGDIMHILSSLRQDRGGMIQTKEQYVFIHQVLLRYAKSHRKQVASHNHGRLETTIEEDEPL